MALEHRASRPAIGGNSLLTTIRQLLGVSSSSARHDQEDSIRAAIISAVVSTEVGAQNGTNKTASLTFSRPPHDVTEYIKRRLPYPDDTSGFSDIFRCVLDKPGEPMKTVAVKAFKVPGIGRSPEVLQTHAKKLRGEIHIWSRLDHPNVLRLYGIADGFSHLPALVSQWAENGTLTQYLEGPGRDISKDERTLILVRVAKALHYIHSEHVVHGDLTGSNILINGDGQPLISDFGLSSILREYDETSYFHSGKPGALRWAAPELLAQSPESPPTIQSDVYSFGCVMLLTLSGQVPYNEIRDIHLAYAKINGIRPRRPTGLPIEDAHWNMIEVCTDSTPNNRPVLPDIIDYLARQRA
ncbi:hypothetical protein PAXRUDRAFT_387447 [Paxillus rubicundulus Ve08.2h10]|uniref:Protein kinase domain-containing protein n=1 Tax=Paxillus rubicundulus Ve08.2h10 TaxID=930991 RepID=A0A0D0C2A3_9AGAM|nr:hypothetical protein PAXRUDRAFT_387447 [Paxillus rubicundulus Ve08.2h10]